MTEERKCLICESPFPCKFHDAPSSVEGEPFFVCSICLESMLSEECKPHAEMHITEAVLSGVREGF